MSDDLHMREALRLAPEGMFRVEPNPLVGAVVVRDGEVVGRGFHARYGWHHAEVAALLDAKDRVRGSTVYVTLEPCGHHGKRPPCADHLAAKGVARVVYAAADPNPVTAGKGPALLREAGIQVEAGLLAEEARALNVRYEAHLGKGRPWVIAKWAMSLDGKIADATGAPGPISGAESHRLVHEIRGAVDAVAAGVGTVLADDPDLRPRHAETLLAPVRVVIDTRFRTPLRSRLVRTAEDPVWIAGARTAAPDRAAALEAAGCRILDVPEGVLGLDLRELMARLYEAGIRRVLLEGGGRVHASAMAAGVVDQVTAFCAPVLLGGADAPTPMDGPGLHRIGNPLRLEEVRTSASGEDALIEGFVPRGSTASRSAER